MFECSSSHKYLINPSYKGQAKKYLDFGYEINQKLRGILYNCVVSSPSFYIDQLS